MSPPCLLGAGRPLEQVLVPRTWEWDTSGPTCPLARGCPHHVSHVQAHTAKGGGHCSWRGPLSCGGERGMKGSQRMG